MKEVISNGATTIFVSHSLSQTRSLCNKVLWLDKDKQMAFGEAGKENDAYEAFLQKK